MHLGGNASLENVRVRYAPSPTGQPHLGNVRTALFNWLFARRYGGKFVVRIEDTDQERAVDGVVEAILESLRWLELDWDEGPDADGPYGPYVQSQRLDIYHEATERLISAGRAYRCYCTRERLDELRKTNRANNLPNAGYDGHCRYLTDTSLGTDQEHGTPHTVRFAMPSDGETELVDLIRGDVSWDNSLLDDFVILKSDGFPTYHLANVLDDHLMEISHVLRAEEWLSSTPRHLRLYEALGYEPPQFGHLPMILGPDRSKLSKRHGATALLEYRDAGYLSEAMVNFMALLGWSLDDKTDVISRDELTQVFSLEQVGKSGAIFDQERLLWMNGVYIRGLQPHELARRAYPFVLNEMPEASSNDGQVELARVMPLLQERLKTLKDTPEMASYFFEHELTYDDSQLVPKGMERDATSNALSQAHATLADLPDFRTATIEAALRCLTDELGISGRQLFGALRVATTGRTAAPPLFETMEVLGRERCLNRIQRAAELLGTA